MHFMCAVYSMWSSQLDFRYLLSLSSLPRPFETGSLTKFGARLARLAGYPATGTLLSYLCLPV
ncbi:mCG147135 [Mus musculus]|nr:mCG147135 [Mus musculus]